MIQNADKFSVQDIASIVHSQAKALPGNIISSVVPMPLAGQIVIVMRDPRNGEVHIMSIPVENTGSSLYKTDPDDDLD